MAAVRDFEKAFDKAFHWRSLAKVSTCKVTGHLTNWIGSCISYGKQRVAVSGRMSCWEDVSGGVPQGSVMGPILLLAEYPPDG